MERIEKACTFCKEVKSLTEFYKVGKYLRAHCKPCEISRSARWKKKQDPARVRKLRRAYVEQNRQKLYQCWYAWRKNHRHLSNLWAGNRRANKLNATPKWANKFFMEEAYLLAQLRSKATGMKWEVDHIVPLQSKIVCGLHVENNLRVVPMSINRQKSNTRWPDMPGAI